MMRYAAAERDVRALVGPILTVARAYRCALALTVLPVILPVTAYAQASITGVVRDTSGAVLPGVTVEAASPALIERVRSVVSDGGGQYRIVDLRPGVYSVTFTLTGFNTFKSEGIELTGDFTATINAELRVGALAETITVTGATPIVDVQGVSRQKVLTTEVVEAVPTGKYFVNLGVLIPGVSASCSAACQSGTSQDTGGASGDNMSTLIVHGSRFRDQRIAINNLTVRGSTGYLGVTGPNIEAMQETQIDTSGADASVGTGGVRINVIPKDGGNAFKGGLFLTGTNENFQSDNLDQSLKDRGLAATSRIKSVYDVAATFGGPIKKDKLWFFLSYRYNNALNYAANVFQNANRNNPNVWTYAPDLTLPGITHDPLPMAGGRLTWQVTPKNKVAASFDFRDRCQCTNLGNGGNFGLSPDAAVDFRFRPQQIAMVTWSLALTNKLLLEAAAVDLVEGWGNRPSVDAANPSMIRVTAQNPPASFLGITTFRGASSNTNWTQYPYRDLAFNATYVTGAHAFKAGVEYDWGWNDRWLTANAGSMVTNIYGQAIPITSYQINYATGVPVFNQFTTSLDPTHRYDQARADGGLFVQDRWTHKRLTLSGGLRFDYFYRDTAAVTEGPTVLQPMRNLTFPDQQVVGYKDLSPRMGLAWDVFGTGKMAVKVSLNRYVQDLSLLANNLYSNQQNYQSTASRPWTDSNGNGIPDCNPLIVGAQNNTATGGDICGALTGANANFGLSVPTSTPDPDVVGGFNHRGYDWEFSASVQRELIPRRVALDVGYFRRSFGNFVVTHNPLSTAANYDPFSVVVPIDSRLPLSGQTLAGFVNANPSIASLVTTNQDRFASNYGNEYEYWHGIDVSVNTRLGGSTVAQGGLSTGKQVLDICAVLTQVPEATTPTVSLSGATGSIASQLGMPFCHQEQPWLLQIKGLATYTIPHVDVQLSGTFQSVPGPQLAANLVVPSLTVQTTGGLGRPLSGGAANVTVPIVAPGSLYGDRLNQTDFRVGKVIRFPGNRRVTASVDMFNLFNGHAVLTQQSSYSLTNATLWQTPQLVQSARLLKFTASMYF
jgi:hypothetical protein